MCGVTRRHQEILDRVFQRELPLPLSHKLQGEAFARKMISLLGKAKTHGMREFMLINDRLSTFLTQHAGEMAFVQRSQGSTYLFYYENTRAGIDHLKSNLQFYLLEAGELNRTCVLTRPGLHPFHNNGVDISESWSKYIEFGKSIFPKKIDFIFYREFLKKNFSKNEILVVRRGHKIKPAENKKYKVIIRDIGAFRRVYKSLQLVSELPVSFYPSKRIIDEAKIVLDQIPETFFAVAIRRGDLLNSIDSLAEKISPQNVMKKLQEYNHQKLPIFIMTNEPNRNYYDNLSDEFEVYRYHDFDNLAQIAEEGDNYLLYEIEKLIFLQAKTQIHTFKNTWNKDSLSGINRNAKMWQRHAPANRLKSVW